MTKRSVSLILAAVLLLSLLSGCGKTPDKTTDPTESPYSGEVPNVVNGVYATCENYDFTIYTSPATQPKFEFYLVTQNPLPSEVDIVLNDVEADVKIEIGDCTPGRLRVNREIYMFLQNPDMDWAAYYAERERLYSERQRLEEQLFGEAGDAYDSSEELREAYDEACKAYAAFTQRYDEEMEAYEKTNPKSKGHLYRVIVRIRAPQTRQQVKSLTLNAGEMSREIPLKNVWVDPRPISGTGSSIPGVKKLQSLTLPGTRDDGHYQVTDYFPDANGDRAASTPWKTGTQCLMSKVCFEATADINLKNAYSHGDNDQIKVEYVDLAIVSPQGTAITSRWYPGTDFMIRKGEKVAMAIYWSDPATEQANYAMNAIFVVEYEVDGKIWKLAYDYVICRSLLSACEPYLWVFEQMDFESFYREYANKIEGYVPFSGVFG